MSAWRFRRKFSKRPHSASERRDGVRRKRNRAWADWPGLLGRDDVLILDTETTGLGRDAEVIEVAVINTRGAQVLHSLALPLGAIPRDASRHSRPDESQTEAARRDRLAGPAQRAGCRPCGRPRWSSSTTPPTTNGCCNQTCELYDLPLPPVAWRCAMQDYAAWHRKMRGETSGYGLERAFKRECGERFSQEHRALSDCRMVLALMQAVTGGHRA